MQGRRHPLSRERVRARVGGVVDRCISQKNKGSKLRMTWCAQLTYSEYSMSKEGNDMAEQNGSIHLADLVRRFPELEPTASVIQAVVERICSAYRAGSKILVCGNGGSASDSEHIVGELMKGFVLRRSLADEAIDRFKQSGLPNAVEVAARLQYGVPAVSLAGHPSLATAIANDTDASMVFAQQVFVLGKPGDVLLGLSTSGNSVNVVNAVTVARVQGLATIAMTGAASSRLEELCDITLKVPTDNTHRAQEYHLPIYHAICLMVEASLFS